MNWLVVFAVLYFVASSYGEETQGRRKRFTEGLIRPVQKLGRKMLGIRDREDLARCNAGEASYCRGAQGYTSLGYGAPSRIVLENNVPLVTNLYGQSRAPVAYNAPFTTNFGTSGLTYRIPQNNQFTTNWYDQPQGLARVPIYNDDLAPNWNVADWPVPSWPYQDGPFVSPLGRPLARPLGTEGPQCFCY